MILSSDQITSITNTHLSVFNAKVDILTETITTDSYGAVVKTPTTTSNVECGFKFTNSDKSYNKQGPTVEYDAVLRLPLSYNSIRTKDKIVLKERNGVSQNITFEVYSEPDYDYIVTIKLKRING